MAGDGGEDLLGVLLVSWRGSSEVEGVVLVDSELGMAIYSRPEVVLVNGITPTTITVVKWPDGWLRWLGINVEVHWFQSAVNLGLIWLAPRFGRNGASRARRQQRARPVLARPRRRCCGARRGADGHAEASGDLGGGGRRRKLQPLPVGRHGWLCHRRCCRRRRDTPPPMPTPGQASVRRMDKAGVQCARSQARALVRLTTISEENDADD